MSNRRPRARRHHNHHQSSSSSSSRSHRPPLRLKQFYHDELFSDTALVLIARILGEVCASNDQRDNITSKFTAARRPNIGLEEYLRRIAKYAECSNGCFISALIYIDRVQTQSQFVVDTLNIHRLFVTSCMLAAKFYDDVYFNNAFWARIGGINTRELNGLELELLFLLHFNLHIDERDFMRYGSELQRHAIRYNVQHCASDWMELPVQHDDLMLYGSVQPLGGDDEEEEEVVDDGSDDDDDDDDDDVDAGPSYLVRPPSSSTSPPFRHWLPVAQ